MNSCLSQYEFEREVQRCVRNIAEAEEELRSHRKRLHQLAMRGNCSECENRLMCVTQGKEME